MVAIPWRFKSSYPHHVAADGISFAATFLQKSLLTHSVAAPLRIEPAVSGLRFGFLPEWGIFFVNALHVVADCVSFATAFFYFKTNAVSHSLRRASDSPAKAAGFAGGYKPPLAHAVAAPHQIDPVLRRAAIRDFGSAEIPVCPAMPRPAPASRLRLCPGRIRPYARAEEISASLRKLSFPYCGQNDKRGVLWQLRDTDIK